MKDEFKPPIKDRTTKELLNIVGSSDKWNPKAVKFAENELVNRNVPSKKIVTAKYLSKKKDTIKKRTKANESYHFCDFILSPVPTLFEITLS